MRIIIIGCGRMGSGLALMLVKQGHHVTVIDTDPKALEQLGSGFTGRTLVGTGFDRAVLIRAGIEQSDGLAAVTASDDSNALIARLARQVFRVPRVVARLYDPRKAEVYRRLGIQTIATITWGIQRIADLLCYSRLDTIVSLGNGEIELVEEEIPALLVGRTVRELTIPGELQVVALSRTGRSMLPTLGTVFQPGDRVYLAVHSASIERLKALLGM